MRVNNRIDTRFKQLRSEDKAAFIAYVCGGDPDPSTSLEILHTLRPCEGGYSWKSASLFQTPLADGLVNQLASERALKAGSTTAANARKWCGNFARPSETPIVLYAYLNNLYAYGYENFQRDALEAGRRWHPQPGSPS